MNKKSYMAPQMELAEIEAPVIMAGSPGDGLNGDYSAPTNNNPSDSQPESW